jgi:transposase
MALVLTWALSLLIMEVDMPPRKPSTKTAHTTAKPSPRKARRKTTAASTLLQTLHPYAAGIDVGANELWVCFPPGEESNPPAGHPKKLPAWVRCFRTFTADLHALVAQLRAAKVTTVALESTGVYWIPGFDLLQAEGFHVVLVDPRQVQRAPGRPKTDVHDCMWIQRLHSLGLLSAAFRPDEPIRVLRS